MACGTFSSSATEPVSSIWAGRAPLRLSHRSCRVRTSRGLKYAHEIPPPEEVRVANALVGAFQQVDFFFGGAFCALFIGLFVISLLIAIWVYRDAERLGMSGVLWLL